MVGCTKPHYNISKAICWSTLFIYLFQYTKLMFVKHYLMFDKKPSKGQSPWLETQGQQLPLVQLHTQSFLQFFSSYFVHLSL